MPSQGKHELKRTKTCIKVGSRPAVRTPQEPQGALGSDISGKELVKR